MRKLSLAIIAFMASLCCHAQTESLLSYSEVALGRKADGSNLMMHVVPTDGKVTYFKISEKMPYVLIGNEKGIKMYNTETGEYITDVKLGSKKLAQLCPDGYLTYSEGGLFLLSFGSLTFYNLDGKKVWSNKQMVVMANGKSNVLVCEKHSKQFFFTGYEMNTGRELWQKSISGTKCYPFLPSHCYNVPGQEGSYYIIGDSIFKLNIATGQLIGHPFEAGIKQSIWAKPQLSRRASPTNLEFAMEMMASYSVRNNVLTGTGSNLIIEGDRLYIADARNVYCLDNDLNTVWQTPIPDEMGARSRISVDGNKVRLINFGIAFQKGTSFRCGMPFIASYDKSSGRQLAMDKPDLKKKIYGGIYTAGRAYWQTLNGFYYNNEGDTLAHKIHWEPQTTNKPTDNYPNFVLCDTVGILSNGTFKYVCTDKEKMVVEVYDKDVNMVSPDGSCKLITANEVYVHGTGSVYYTNGDEDKPRSFVVLDAKTKQIKYTFHLTGNVIEDYLGNLFVITHSSIGFLKHQ